MSGLCEGQCRASPHLPAKPGRNHTGTMDNDDEDARLNMHGLPPAPGTRRLRQRRDTGAAAAPVSLTLPTPGSRLRRWPAWATCAGTLLHRQQRVPRRPVAFRPCRPPALHGATKGKLRRPPPLVFPWNLFLPPGMSGADARLGLRERCETPAPTASPCRATARHATAIFHLC